MRIDPEKIGVWVPAYIAALTHSGSAAMLLAQLSWLLQEDRTHTSRSADIVERDDGEWLACADSDWDGIGLDRGEAYRARRALVKDGLIFTRPGSLRGRKCTLLRPDFPTLAIARNSAIAVLQGSRGTARPIAPSRAGKSAEPRDSAISLDLTVGTVGTSPPAAAVEEAPKATDDPVKAWAHKLTVLAFEQPVKPVLRGAVNGSSFPAAMAIIESLLRAKVSVQAVEAAIRSGVAVWTVAGLQTAIAQAAPRRTARGATPTGTQAVMDELMSGGNR